METPKRGKDFIVEIKGKTYRIDILKLIFVLTFITLPITGIVYLMFKFHWLLYALLIISYVALSIFTFAKNVRVLDVCGTALCCRASEHYNFSKEENDAILKVMASVSINMIVLLSLIIVASSKPLSWIPCAFVAFCLFLALIELVALIKDGYYQVFIPWVKGEIFKNIKDGN